MLNIIIILVGSYAVFTLLTAVIGFFINKFFATEIDRQKMLQISNAGLGTSLMLCFMSMLVILQLDVKAEEKTLYLFAIYVVSYLLTICIALYSHIISPSQ